MVFWLHEITYWWFLPVLAGMYLSIPLSVMTSRSGWGSSAKQAGLFLVPEEVSPPAEIVVLRLRMAEMDMAGETAPRPANAGLADVVLNPYVNAVHVSLLREKRLNPIHTETLAKMGVNADAVRTLGEKLLAAGPDSLTAQQKLLVLSDANTMSWLHRHAWLRPNETFSPWWQQAFLSFSR